MRVPPRRSLLRPLRLRAWLVTGLALATCPMVARPDVGPEEEILLGESAIASTVEIAGLSRFPDHVFYLFPAYCTTALAALDEQTLEFYEQDEFADRPNYIELAEGPLTSWISRQQSDCQDSRIYAIAREFAGELELAAMPLDKLREFFADDPRLFRSDFEFPPTPRYAARGSLLRKVHEVVRILRVTDEGVAVAVDSATYRFADDTEQTLKLTHTRRPALPFRPLKPEKLAKYAATHAKWEARQPPEPPPAPRLPAATDPTTGEPGGSTSASTTEPGSSTSTATTEPPGVPPPPTPAATEPARPTPPGPPAELPSSLADILDDPEDMTEATGPVSADVWPLGAGLAAATALAAGLALARRRRPRG